MIIGTGIFVIVGKAAPLAGPALILSFVLAGIACALAALCYAEFAAMVPVAGSAYTYAYATLGELLAWVIGWDLILEYGVAAATVAQGASNYFQNLIGIFGLKLPDVLTNAPFDYEAGHFFSTGKVLALPALLLTIGITAVLVRGIRQSAMFNLVMVILKIAIVLLIIVAGAAHFKSANWHDFAPYGLFKTGEKGQHLGILAGAGIVFFAYIGFDSVSNHAEDARAPQRDVPIAIIASLMICTALYMGVSAVLIGMVPYDKVSPKAPLADAFKDLRLIWVQGLVALGATVGIASVMLVTMLSQTRILLAMARDGLLPQKFFGEIHRRFRTPWKSTILTGLFVGLLASLLPLGFLLELVNIGTLLAFVIVCAAVPIMRRTHPDVKRPFRTPLVPFVPILGILTCSLLMYLLPFGNWLRLGAWLLIGAVVYFAYGRKHSLMARPLEADPPAPGRSQIILELNDHAVLTQVISQEKK
jgi:APA family basic amino acid/polyamine antiporter